MSAEQKKSRYIAERRQVNGLHDALESQSAVLSIASSAAGTKRTRSSSPTVLPSPRQARKFLFAASKFFWIPPV
jgi:hypothetical protein